MSGSYHPLVTAHKGCGCAEFQSHISLDYLPWGLRLPSKSLTVLQRSIESEPTSVHSLIESEQLLDILDLEEVLVVVVVRLVIVAELLIIERRLKLL